MAPRFDPRSTLLVISISVAVLLVASILVVALRPQADVAPGTPEATAVAFVEAVVDGDAQSAETLLSPRFAARCRIAFAEGSLSQARIRQVDVDGDTAEVEVDIAFTSAESPFAFNERSSRTRLSMEHIAGSWLISNESWELFHCRGGN